MVQVGGTIALERQYVVVSLLLIAILPLALPSTLAGPAIVHTFTGNVVLKHVAGGAVACTVNGTVQIDVYSAASISAGAPGLANVSVQSGYCFTQQEKYTAASNGNGWSLSDPVTHVPGSLTPITSQTGDITGYRALIIMRTPLEPQSNFTQITGTNLAETTIP